MLVGHLFWPLDQEAGAALEKTYHSIQSLLLFLRDIWTFSLRKIGFLLEKSKCY
jgi:hypothetical protein